MIYDSLNISARSKTPEGFLLAPAVLARAEVLDYTWPESSLLGLNVPESLRKKGQKIRIYRPEETVFDRATMDGIEGRAVTVEHRGGTVNAENYRSLNVGTVSRVRREGADLVGDLLVCDAEAVADLESGKNGISLGYTPQIEWRGGNHATLGAYDGIQKAFAVNHVTLTAYPRSKNARVFDSSNDDTTEKDNTMKRKIYGIDVEIPEAAAEVFDSTLAREIEERAANSKKIEEMNGAIAAKDKQIADLTSKIATVTDCAYLDRAVKERVALIETAKKVSPDLVCDSLNDDEIRKAVVATRIEMPTNADPAFIRGAFTALVAAPVVTDAARIAEGLAKPATPEITMDSLHADFVARCNGNRE